MNPITEVVNEAIDALREAAFAELELIRLIPIGERRNPLDKWHKKWIKKLNELNYLIFKGIK